MDTLTLLVTAANLDPTHALELTLRATVIHDYRRRVYIVGHCGRAFNLEERLRDEELNRGYVLESAEVVYYSLSTFGSHGCLVCKRPHGLGPFAKYAPEVKTVLTQEDNS